MEHKFNTGKYGEVHYWVGGQGYDCIVFTHGATMDHGLFQEQIDPFVQHYRVIVWDVPGHGCSRPYEAFSLTKAAGELIEILNTEKIVAAHLIGQSMGGYISQFVARDHPDRVLSLTALDSSPLQPSYYSVLDNWLLSLTPAILKFYPYGSLVKTIAKQIALEEPAQAYALKTLQTYTKAEIIEIMDQVYQGVRAYQCEIDLQIPVLIVYGEADRTGKVKAYSQQWAARENRPLRVISNAAHNANMDNPAEFNRILETFLRELSPNTNAP
jgi:pimeloyl-ACP methyl ester carboxylesterase